MPSSGLLYEKIVSCDNNVDIGDHKRTTGAQAGNRTPGSCVGGDYVTTTPLARLWKTSFFEDIGTFVR